MMQKGAADRRAAGVVAGNEKSNGDRRERAARSDVARQISAALLSLYGTVDGGTLQ